MQMGIDLIYTERRRQIDEEGWTAEKDDRYNDGSLSLAAICFATPFRIYIKDELANGPVFFDPWPWDQQFDKRFDYGERRYNPGNSVPDPSSYSPEERLDLLVKSGALIAAEIDLFSSRNKEIAAQYFENIKKSFKQDNPWCNSCKEEHCCVDPDGTCEMITVYLEAKNSEE